MNPIWRNSSKGARRERRLGAYWGAIGDVAHFSSNWRMCSPGALNRAQPRAHTLVFIRCWTWKRLSWLVMTEVWFWYWRKNALFISTTRQQPSFNLITKMDFYHETLWLPFFFMTYFQEGELSKMHYKMHYLLFTYRLLKFYRATLLWS